MPEPHLRSAVFSNPNQISILGSGGNRSLQQKKKLIALSFQILAKKEINLNSQECLIGHLFRVCSRFVVVLVAQLKSRRSCVAYRLPVVVRFPAGPRVRLKCRRPAERQRARTKKKVAC